MPIVRSSLFHLFIAQTTDFHTIGIPYLRSIAIVSFYSVILPTIRMSWGSLLAVDVTNSTLLNCPDKFPVLMLTDSFESCEGSIGSGANSAFMHPHETSTFWMAMGLSPRFSCQCRSVHFLFWLCPLFRNRTVGFPIARTWLWCLLHFHLYPLLYAVDWCGCIRAIWYIVRPVR